MKFKKRKGSVLAFILVILMIISIFTMTIIFINMTNARQVILQQEQIQAYYLAYSGAEMAYAALVEVDKFSGKSIVDTFDTTDKKVGPNEIDLNEDGLNDISIVVNYDSKKKTVIITSIGTHRASNKSVTLRMSFNKERPTIKLWE